MKDSMNIENTSCVRTLDGEGYARLLFGGGALLAAHADELNDLNVFPVPDGDTGSNMIRTVEGGLAEIAASSHESVGAVSSAFTRGTLLGARGNSGVILSQIFAGLNETLADAKEVDAATLGEALAHAVRRAYGAVREPVEGTILTVLREATECVAAQSGTEAPLAEFLRLHLEAAERALEKTKELLPALAEADVVDSGGAGYVCFVRGMYRALRGEVDTTFRPLEGERSTVDINSFTRDSVLTYGYCTEFLLRLTTNKVDPDTFDIGRVHAVLEALGGESIVAYLEGDVVKVHVHTFTPGAVLSEMQAFGEFLTLKIENMSVGHSASTVKAPPKKSDKPFSVLAVATGEGLCALLRDAGADAIVTGGQSANPSTSELLSAFAACGTPSIIVLPNNKNVFLAAKQAAELYEDGEVYIVPTHSVMEGYAALSVITPGITDLATLTENATRAAQEVLGGEIARAVKDAAVGGKAVKAGEYIAIVDGAIAAKASTPEDAVLGMLSGVGASDYELLTLFVGEGVTEAARASLTERIASAYEELAVTVYEGGQVVYDYLVALE